MIKRILIIQSNFLAEYEIFNNKFIFRGLQLNEFLSLELDKIKQVRALRANYKQKIIKEISEHVTKDSNKRTIIEPEVKPKVIPKNKYKDLKSPYNVKAFNIEETIKKTNLIFEEKKGVQMSTEQIKQNYEQINKTNNALQNQIVDDDLSDASKTQQTIVFKDFEQEKNLLLDTASVVSNTTLKWNQQSKILFQD